MFKINQLKTDYQVNPVGIVNLKPRFSWNYVQSSQLTQKSYRILVASSYELLEKMEPDLWDSEIVFSDEMVGITYQGKALVSRQVCHVLCVAESISGETDRHYATFEMGLMLHSDFKGRWVSIPSNFNGSTLYFRKNIAATSKKIVRARAYICGVGYHEFYLNGKKISDRVLNPGVTEYSKTLLYDVYDITNELEEENNVVGVEVGYGWFGSRKMLAQFYFDYEDGTTLEDHSDCNSGWWVSGSPITDNSIYGGEIYDARVEERFAPNWSSRDFEPTWGNGWMYTILTQAPTGKLMPQVIEPIRINRTFETKSRRDLTPTVSVFDVGQNLAGWARITVKGKRGSQVKLIFAEGLCEDGTVNQLNLRSARASDTYILKGDGIEVYAPRFTYHGFQYVQTETEGDVEIIRLVAEHVHTDVHKTGEFECSHPDLNQLHKNAVITEQNNLHSIMTDCPQRDERFGWLNDLTTRVHAASYNFRMDRLYAKIVHDIFETQNAAGAIADTAPYYTGGQPADVTSVSYLLLGLFAHRFYGDKGLVYNEYEGFKKWVDYLLTRQKNYIMEYYHYADWVAPASFTDSVTDNLYVSTVFLYWHLKSLSQLARIVNKTEDAEKYGLMAEESKKAINKKYYHQEKFSYSNGTQTENAMALNLGIAKEEDRAKIAANIAQNVIDHNYHSTSGNQGYMHVFFALTEAGYSDLLIKMITNPEYPGWGYMLSCGATTVWERWESKMENIMHSFNHPMFGAYDAWFYRYFGGIVIGDEASAKSISIKPYIPKMLNFVNCSFESIRGTIVSNWKKVDDGIHHYITIPSNSTAELLFEKPIQSMNGQPVELMMKDQRFYVKVESGTYEIITKE